MKRWRIRRAGKARRVAPPGETGERNCATKTELRRYERRASGERRIRGECESRRDGGASERRANENRDERIAANDGRRTGELHGRRAETSERMWRTRRASQLPLRRIASRLERARRLERPVAMPGADCRGSENGIAPGSNGPDVLSARSRCRAPTVGATKTELRRSSNGVATRVAIESQRNRNGVATESQRNRE